MTSSNPDQQDVPRLIIDQPDQPQRQVMLHGEGYRLGRDPEMEISIQHPAVSRLHALLQRQGKGQCWILRDLDSTNGLWWRGKRVREVELRDGDSISLAPATETDAPSLSFLNPAERPWDQLRRWTGATLIGGLGSAVLLFTLANLTVPVRGRLAMVRGPLALYDRNDRPLASAESSRHRELDSLRDFSPTLVDALLASEDNRFWWHPGMDPIGTARALLVNLTGGQLIEGGSSLTQQLARSLYPEMVGQGDTLLRKWRELMVALQLENRFSKAELLLSYLNRVYLGVGWGFEDAARIYFGKSARQLNLQESALLVGLLPSPNGHDPCQAPQLALEARNRVLNKMADSGRLSLDQARAARRRPIKLSKQACSRRNGSSAPFYSDQVRRDLTALVGADVAAEGNFLIETHLDPVLQAVVERQLRNLLNSASGLGISQGAAVVIDSRNGGVLAIAGGKDYRFSQFNRASMALRQPGSTFKLMTYLAALKRGIKPADRIDCRPLEWGGQRFESSCNGSLSLNSAFARSSNTAALRLARRVGLEQVIVQARALGISTPLDPVPGLALGQSEVLLIELTSAYAAVANDGLWHQPTTIRRLMDAESCSDDERKRCSNLTGAASGRESGSGSESRSGSESGNSARQGIDPAVAKQMQAMLRNVVRSGTGHSASLGGLEGGKTGTTNQGRDLLFIGYEPSRHWVLGIWLGNDDNSPSQSSSALAAGLWADIIRSAGRGSVSNH